MKTNDEYMEEFNRKTKSAKSYTGVVVFILCLCFIILIMLGVLIDFSKENDRLTADLKDLKSKLSARDSEVRKKESEIANAYAKNAQLNNKLVKANSDIREQQDQLEDADLEIREINKQTLKIAGFLKIYITANSPSENNSARFDIDTLMKVFSDFQENISIIGDKFALLQNEADGKEGWLDEDYIQMLRKSLAINAEVVKLRDNLFKYGLIEVHAYNLAGKYKILRQNLDATKRPLTWKQLEEFMKQSMAINKELFGARKVAN